MLKNKIASFLLAKLNLNKISDLVSRSFLLKIPYKFFAQRMVTYDFPLHIFVETTSACNLKCEICPRTHGDTLIGHMDFKLFKKIINEAKSYGPRTFCLHLFGEPLVSPDFQKMVRYIKQADKANTIVLTTNGTLMSGENAQAIVDAPVDKIAVSFPGAEKHSYFRTTGVDNLETVEKNVLDLIELKKTKKSDKPLVSVRMIVNKDNQNEINLFKKKWKNKPLNVEVRPSHNYGGYVPRISLRRKSNKRKRYPCYHLWFSPAIHWNGDFSICCNDYGRKALLGNTKDQSVYQIWNSKKLREYRRAHLKGRYHKVPLCQNCDVWTMYEDVFFKWQKK